MIKSIIAVGIIVIKPVAKRLRHLSIALPTYMTYDDTQIITASLHISAGCIVPKPTLIHLFAWLISTPRGVRMRRIDKIAPPYINGASL